MAKQSAKRLSNGRYSYKGYTLINYGYYAPDRCVWWQAINQETDCADFTEHSKKELMQAIDEETATLPREE